MNARKWIALVISSLLILLELGMIFVFSSQNGETSGSLSQAITAALLRFFGNDPESMAKKEWTNLLHHWGLYVRKAAHMTEFGLLAALISVQLRCLTRLRFPGLPALAVTLVCAAADEYHQSFVVGRSAAITDVLIDFAGAVIGVLICAGAVALFRRMRKRRATRKAAAAEQA